MNSLHHQPLDLDWPVAPAGAESDASGMTVLLKAQYAWMAAVGMPSPSETTPPESGNEQVDP